MGEFDDRVALVTGVADYWMHNKGAAPIGYQPLSVQIVPWAVSGGGPFRLPVTVASERTDDAVAGSVVLVVPPGWQASPAERVFRLAPEAYLAFEATVSPAAGASPGRYFVAARITDDAGQTHEDVVTIDYRPDGDGQRPGADVAARSPSLTRAVQRALHDAGGPSDASPRSEGAVHDDLGGELVAELQDAEVRLRAGQPGAIRVRLRNEAASEIRGEAQLLSPHETWPFTSPWTQGFAVGPGETTTLTYEVQPPIGFAGGTYWALVKVMYFGRIIYTESIPIQIDPVEVRIPARAVEAG